MNVRYLILIGLTLLSGCALDSDNQGSNGSGVCELLPESIAALSSSGLLGELQRNCASCHNSVAPRAPSPFADANPVAAYPYAKRFSDFKNPNASFFVERMRQNHECGSSCATIAQAFVREIDAWAKEEAKFSQPQCDNSLSKGTVVQTSTDPLPTNILLEQTQKIQFDLSKGTPSLPGAILQVTAKRISDPVGDDPGSFIFYDPVLAIAPLPESPGSNLRITRMNFITERNADLYRTWAGLDFIIKPASFNAALPLNQIPMDGTQLLGNWGDSSTISAQFTMELTGVRASVPKYNPYLCKATNTFNNNVMNQFRVSRVDIRSGQSKVCTECHQLGMNIFPLDSPGVDNCQEVKRRGDTATPALSRIHTYPEGDDHPGGKFVFSAGEKTNLSNWLIQER